MMTQKQMLLAAPSPIRNVIVRCGGRKWKIREARSFHDVEEAIATARVSGSVGSRSLLDMSFVGGGLTVLADVVQINSDGTERKPYTEAY